MLMSLIVLGGVVAIGATLVILHERDRISASTGFGVAAVMAVAVVTYLGLS